MRNPPEVLSVPVGKTSALVEAYHVHACPDRYSYRPTPYITFRPSGGAMSAVYANDTIYKFCPTSPLPTHIPEEHRDRLRRYVADRLAAGLFSHPSEVYRFYVLSPETAIRLAHRPVASTNLQGHGYFTLPALTSGESVVSVCSKTS